MTESNGRAAIEDATRYWPRAYGFALALTGEPARAEDLCQEAYLRILTSKREIDTARPLIALLARIIRNLHLSEARRSNPVHLEVPESVVDEHLAPPPAVASRREAAASVHAALDRLKPLWRAALYLKDGLGLTYAEISDVTGMTTDVVRVTLHRARKRVRTSLGSRSTGSRNHD